MDSSFFRILNKLSLKTRFGGKTSETFIGSVSASRLYCTERSHRTNLHSKISPLGDPRVSVVPELDKWVEEGKKVKIGELQRIIRDLRKHKRYGQALEVSEWMKNKGFCIFSPGDHAVRLDLIGRVHGLDSAESYFNNMSDQDKTNKTYGALLNCYVRGRLTDKSLNHMQKMKEMGFALSALPYNNLMCLYTSLGQYEKVPLVLSEMKQDGIPPDNYSYRICINSYGERSDINEMEKLLEEMESQSHILMDWSTYTTVANFYIKAGLIEKAITSLKKSEEKIDGKNRIGYNHLISLYATLGHKDEVLRLWPVLEATCKRYLNRDYIAMLGALVKLGELEEAEKILKQWESSCKSYDFRVPNTLLVGYCEKGLIEKAESMLEDIMKNGKTVTANSWVMVVEGYMDKLEMERAVECMKKALKLDGMTYKWWPDHKVFTRILSWLGDNGDVENLEAFVNSMRTVIPMNRQMYHALIKSNIRGGKPVDGILDSMKADNVVEDDETKEILALKQDTAE